MNRTIAALAMIAGASLAASAAHALPQKGTPAADNPKGAVATATPTAEGSIVKTAMRDAGFSGVNSLTREADGTWRARAIQNNAPVVVTYDRSGQVRAQ